MFYFLTRGGPCHHGFMCGCRQWSNDQGWGRLQKPDYDYDYDYSAHKIIDYDYDYDYSGD